MAAGWTPLPARLVAELLPELTTRDPASRDSAQDLPAWARPGRFSEEDGVDREGVSLADETEAGLVDAACWGVGLVDTVGWGAGLVDTADWGAGLVDKTGSAVGFVDTADWVVCLVDTTGWGAGLVDTTDWGVGLVVIPTDVEGVALAAPEAGLVVTTGCSVAVVVAATDEEKEEREKGSKASDAGLVVVVDRGVDVAVAAAGIFRTMSQRSCRQTEK